LTGWQDMFGESQ